MLILFTTKEVLPSGGAVCWRCLLEVCLWASDGKPRNGDKAHLGSLQ